MHFGKGRGVRTVLRECVHDGLYDTLQVKLRFGAERENCGDVLPFLLREKDGCDDPSNNQNQWFRVVAVHQRKRERAT